MRWQNIRDLICLGGRPSSEVQKGGTKFGTLKVVRPFAAPRDQRSRENDPGCRSAGQPHLATPSASGPATARGLRTALPLRSPFLPKKFNNHISDECSDHSNGKIDPGKNILDSPSQTTSPLHSRTREFTHQQVGIKEEDYKTNLGYGPSDSFLHCLYLNVFAVPGTSGFRLVPQRVSSVTGSRPSHQVVCPRQRRDGLRRLKLGARRHSVNGKSAQQVLEKCLSRNPIAAAYRVEAVRRNADPKREGRRLSRLRRRRSKPRVAPGRDDNCSSLGKSSRRCIRRGKSVPTN